MCLNKISALLHKYLPEKREREKIKIDEFRARTDVDKGVNYLEIPSLDVRNARVKESILKKHEMLFVSGVWRVGVLKYNYKDKKGTGKTYLFRHISYHSRVISGGTITPPVLFYNLMTKTPGLLAINDCVAFDEIENTKFHNLEETLGKLKDFMESGIYDRGIHKVQSSASTIFIGNLPTKDGLPVNPYYFDTLQEYLQVSALLDRLNGFIPGWELSRIQKSETHLTPYYGFAADYFCEILHTLRNYNFERYIKQNLRFLEADKRDEQSIIKVASGMMKLLFPDGFYKKEELKMCVDLAVEYRQRIVDQLHLMDQEYKDKKITYEFR